MPPCHCENGAGKSCVAPCRAGKVQLQALCPREQQSGLPGCNGDQLQRQAAAQTPVQIDMLVSALRLSFELTSGSAAMACCRAVGHCYFEHSIRRAANSWAAKAVSCNVKQQPTGGFIASAPCQPTCETTPAASACCRGRHETNSGAAAQRRATARDGCLASQKTLGWPLGQVTVR